MSSLKISHFTYWYRGESINMEPSSNAENRSTYDGDADNLVINEIKSEPLDDVQSSDLFKINQRKRRVCDGCEKTYSSKGQFSIN